MTALTLRKGDTVTLNAQRLGSSIRAYRERAGISQDELARRIDHDQTFVSRLERAGPDSRIAPASVLNAIGRALSVPVARLLADAGYDLDLPDPAEPMSLARLMEEIERREDVPPRMRSIILEALRESNRQHHS